jgi:hypothetical protein
MRYHLDAEDRLWEDSEVDDGVALVHLLGRGGGDVLPLTAVEQHYGPLTVLVAQDREGIAAQVDRDLVREILEALCRRDGLPLTSYVVPDEPARNYELALRLGIGSVFGVS